jgi:N-acetylmuramoyl-L-alanine amidase
MTPQKIIVHCAATPNGKFVGIDKITEWHKERGWRTCGYHICVEPDGEVERGRPLNVVGAHCEGENYDSIGICLIGNDKFTQKQFDALRYQLDSIRVVYPIPPWAIYGHYQFPSAVKQGKLCPNIPINNLLAWYLTHDEKAIAQYVLKV